MNKKLALYISSKNNYDMLLHEVIPNIDFDGILINIDDNSCKKEQEKGKKICDENNIQFICNKGHGLYMAAQTAISHIIKQDPNVQYVYWLTHDCLPLYPYMFNQLEDLIGSGQLDSFGCVGFNTIWRKFSYSKKEFLEKKLDGRYCGAMGRAVLTKVKGAGWYRSSDFEMKWDVWGKNIAVESVVDMNFMINIGLFVKHIIPDENFRHFCWGDDLGLQFLKNGIYNVTLPNYYVYHDQSIKSRYDIPENSYRAAQSGDLYHFCSHDAHYKRWKDKWGFERDWKNRNGCIPPEVTKKYANTLLNDFICHDYKCGPLKTFEIK